MSVIAERVQHPVSWRRWLPAVFIAALFGVASLPRIALNPTLFSSHLAASHAAARLVLHPAGTPTR